MKREMEKYSVIYQHIFERAVEVAAAVADATADYMNNASARLQPLQFLQEQHTKR